MLIIQQLVIKLFLKLKQKKKIIYKKNQMNQYFTNQINNCCHLSLSRNIFQKPQQKSTNIIKPQPNKLNFIKKAQKKSLKRISSERLIQLRTNPYKQQISKGIELQNKSNKKIQDNSNYARSSFQNLKLEKEYLHNENIKFDNQRFNDYGDVINLLNQPQFNASTKLNKQMPKSGQQVSQQFAARQKQKQFSQIKSNNMNSGNNFFFKHNQNLLNYRNSRNHKSLDRERPMRGDYNSQEKNIIEELKNYKKQKEKNEHRVKQSLKVGFKTPNFTAIGSPAMNMSPKNLKFSTLQKQNLDIEARNNQLFARTSFSVKDLKINRSTSVSQKFMNKGIEKPQILQRKLLQPNSETKQQKSNNFKFYQSMRNPAFTPSNQYIIAQSRQPNLINLNNLKFQSKTPPKMINKSPSKVVFIRPLEQQKSGFHNASNKMINAGNSQNFPSYSVSPHQSPYLNQQFQSNNKINQPNFHTPQISKNQFNQSMYSPPSNQQRFTNTFQPLNFHAGESQFNQYHNYSNNFNNHGQNMNSPYHLKVNNQSINNTLSYSNNGLSKPPSIYIPNELQNQYFAQDQDIFIHENNLNQKLTKKNGKQQANPLAYSQKFKRIYGQEVELQDEIKKDLMSSLDINYSILQHASNNSSNYPPNYRQNQTQSLLNTTNGNNYFYGQDRQSYYSNQISPILKKNPNNNSADSTMLTLQSKLKRRYNEGQYFDNSNIDTPTQNRYAIRTQNLFGVQNSMLRVSNPVNRGDHSLNYSAFQARTPNNNYRSRITSKNSVNNNFLGGNIEDAEQFKKKCGRRQKFKSIVSVHSEHESSESVDSIILDTHPKQVVSSKPITNLL